MGVIVVAIVVSIHWINPSALEELRLALFDQYQQLAPRKQTQPSPVLIVEIDEESLREIGQWPWPRNVFAQLIDLLTEMGAEVVAFDVIFSEEDRLSPKNLASMLSAVAPQMEGLLGRMTDNDAVMAEAMQASRVVLGQPSTLRHLADKAEPSLKTARVAEINGDPRPFLFKFAQTVRSLPALEAASQGIGITTLLPESDNVVRRVPAVANVGGRLVPTLTLEALRVATGQSTIAVRSSSAGIKNIVLQGVQIPTDRQGRIWVHYAEPRREMYISAADLLAGRVDPGRIANRIVLIGASAAGFADLKATPVAGTMAGVEVHANLLETILTNDHLRRPAAVIGAERFSLLFVGLVTAVVGPFLAASWMPVILVVVGAAWLIGSWIAFDQYNLLLDGAYPAAAFAILILWLTFAKYIREERSRRAIRGAFGQYLSPVMVDRLIADPSQLKLAGEKRELTIMFSDIRGFTTLSEQYEDDPELLTRFINRYFTKMSHEVLSREGTIDKYIGDAMMAFWNAPVDCQDHARQACLAALAMIGRIDEINRELREQQERLGRPFTPIEAGIGINTGDCHVGNLGSEQRFNYSALGDAVNVASRIEGQTKLYGVHICIGPTTQAEASDLAILPLDLIHLKGKRLPVWIYAVLGDDALGQKDSFIELKKAHGAMLAAYRARQWNDSERALEACRRLGSDLKLAKLYDLFAGRIASLRVNPPAGEWEGVFVAETK